MCACIVEGRNYCGCDIVLIVIESITHYLQKGSTALHLASDNGHDVVVKILLAAKARVNTQNNVSIKLYYPSKGSF